MSGRANDMHVIVGLGKTGLSCARWLQGQDLPFMAVDTREQPPGAAEFHQAFPGVETRFGPLDADQLCRAGTLVLSPGVDPRLPALVAARQHGVRFTGDIDIFARQSQADMIAITGSNAKSTVTTLVGEMARAAGKKVIVGGNIGTPVLDLLQGESFELSVLELSSFQLETTTGLGATVATILNLSEDHMDRYDSMAEYAAAKQRIFQNCGHAVINRDDSGSEPVHPVSRSTCFGLGLDQSEYGLVRHAGELCLARDRQPLLPVASMKLAGMHNVSNALAALALGEAAGLAMAPMLHVLREFSGLRHRCQWVRSHKGVSWYNDSKGTNVGASVAAISGLGVQGPVILLAGGVGKDADFSALGPVMQQHGRMAILFGEDADHIALVLKPVVEVLRAETLEEAVSKAASSAAPGDVVLLSPACASFDMFRNYEHRGDVFMQAVGDLH
jgi:UDP-N-acetylmuramoylalanine--D-glutamate ligase